VSLPRALARINRYVSNPIQRRWAGLLPGYGIVEHVGRSSGKAYRTPVNVFGSAGGFAIWIGYGLGSDWLRNLQAADGGVLVHRRHRYAVSAPRVVTGAEGLRLLPLPARLMSKLLRAENVLLLDAARR
jgi:deazaflavin-dependent oxidoreductase (nitroreductase family)